MTIQPVHITVDVRIKIDRELENFFADIDKAAGQGPARRRVTPLDQNDGPRGPIGHFDNDVYGQ
jgi:hypothetical protein